MHTHSGGGRTGRSHPSGGRNREARKWEQCGGGSGGEPGLRVHQMQVPTVAMAEETVQGPRPGSPPPWTRLCAVSGTGRSGTSQDSSSTQGLRAGMSWAPQTGAGDGRMTTQCRPFTCYPASNSEHVFQASTPCSSGGWGPTGGSGGRGLSGGLALSHRDRAPGCGGGPVGAGPCLLKVEPPCALERGLHTGREQVSRSA